MPSLKETLNQSPKIFYNRSELNIAPPSTFRSVENYALELAKGDQQQAIRIWRKTHYDYFGNIWGNNLMVATRDLKIPHDEALPDIKELKESMYKASSIPPDQFENEIFELSAGRLNGYIWDLPLYLSQIEDLCGTQSKNNFISLYDKSLLSDSEFQINYKKGQQLYSQTACRSIYEWPKDAVKKYFDILIHHGGAIASFFSDKPPTDLTTHRIPEKMLSRLFENLRNEFHPIYQAAQAHKIPNSDGSYNHPLIPQPIPKSNLELLSSL